MQNKNITIGLAVVLLAAVVIGAVYVVSQRNTVKSLNEKIGTLQQQSPPDATSPANQGSSPQPDQTANPNNTGSGPQNPSGSQTPAAPTAGAPVQNTKPVTTIPVPSPAPTQTSSRDSKRIADMVHLVSAQEMFYKSNNHYYTCSISGGDCKGKINNYPVSIGNFIKNVVDPLNSGVGCGKDYTYCGLDNTAETNKFCYYAKLEGGGYYTASHAGNFKRATPPLSFDECAGAYPNGGNPADMGSSMTTGQARDAQRQADMRQLLSAQELWYSLNNRYYTCGPAGGNCKGAARNYPAAIGSYLPTMPKDPVNSGSGCGRDLVYCGLDNTLDSQKFCFFAKLEAGGYYTASQAGNFKRSTPPATLADCGLPN